MDNDEILRNADFLEIAMEEMDDESVAYGFVEDVYANLLESVET